MFIVVITIPINRACKERGVFILVFTIPLNRVCKERGVTLGGRSDTGRALRDIFLATPLTHNFFMKCVLLLANKYIIAIL